MPPSLSKPNGQDLPLARRQAPKFPAPLSQFAQPVDRPSGSALSGFPGFSIVFDERIQTTAQSSAFQPAVSRQNMPPVYEARRLTGPVQFFAELLKIWRLTNADARILLGFDEADQSRVDLLLRGLSSLRGRDAKDRIASLVRIRTLLKQLFRNEDTENLWLREPKSYLNKRSPLDLILEGSLENILIVRQWIERGAGL